MQDDWLRAGTKFVCMFIFFILFFANINQLASYTLSQIRQEVKEAVGGVTARVYLLRIGNTKADKTENQAHFTSLSDRAQGY